MHFENAYTYAKPFAVEGIGQKETFILRVLKNRMEDYMKEEIDDETFIGLLYASFQSNFSGPAPYGPLGMLKPFVDYYTSRGYDDTRAQDRAKTACTFFFGGIRLEGSLYNEMLKGIGTTKIPVIPFSGFGFLRKE